MSHVWAYVRKVTRLGLCVLAVLAGGTVASAAAAEHAKPAAVHLRWRLVQRKNVEAAAGNDRYVAIVEDAGAGRSVVSLLDEQTDRRATLVAPNCTLSTSLGFDGSWLSVQCFPDADAYDLYDISTRRWVQFHISPQCPGNCAVTEVGRYWVKIVSDGAAMYPTDYYLQNLRTGQFERDPATPGGRVFDDLNTRSGVRLLCSPLRYPYVPDVHSSQTHYLGSLTFSGRFSLSTGAGSALQRCGSNLDLPLMNGDSTGRPEYGFGPLISTRAVIGTSDQIALRGWLLPKLRRFTTHVDMAPFQLVAVTRRSIYIQPDSTGQLWAAALPSGS